MPTSRSSKANLKTIFTRVMLLRSLTAQSEQKSRCQEELFHSLADSELPDAVGESGDLLALNFFSEDCESLTEGW